MDYIFTFEDGSSAMAHYGVKGMKWGVWNQETRDRYFGLGGLRNLALDASNAWELERHADIWNVTGGAGIPPDDAQQHANPYYFLGNLEYTPRLIQAYMMAAHGEQLDLGEYENTYVQALVNCADCTLVYDLRRRGYDVDANMTMNAAYTYGSDIGRYYPEAEHVKISNVDQMVEEVSKMPDGARGGFSGTTVNGGGHAIAWEKEHGEVVFRDCQSGKKYDKKTISELFVINDSKSAQYVRLDDKTPNLARLYDEGLVSSAKSNTREDRQADAVRSLSGKLKQLKYYKDNKEKYDEMMEPYMEKARTRS